MDTVEFVKSICKERRIPISRLERECGFANGYIRTLKKFPADRLAAVSRYLDIPLEDLLEGQHSAPPQQDSGDIKALMEIALKSDNESIRFAVDLLKRLSAYREVIEKAAPQPEPQPFKEENL